MWRILDLSEVACFGSPESQLGRLATINFVYGPNGSGKTSITRIARKIADGDQKALLERDGDGPCSVRIYNREYAEDYIYSPGSLPGVFVAGKGEAATEREIDALKGTNDNPKGKIARQKNKVSALKVILEGDEDTKGLLDQKEELSQSFYNEVWRVKSGLPRQIASLTKGWGGSKRAFATHVLEIAALSQSGQDHNTGKPATEQSTSDPMEELDKNAELILDADAPRPSIVENIPTVGFDQMEGFALMSKSLSPDADLELWPFIEKLGHSDWVIQGVGHLDRSEGACPFCQQTIPDELVARLKALLSVEYKNDVAKAERFAEQAKTQLSVITAAARSASASLMGEPEHDEFGNLLDVLVGSVDAQDLLLDEKLREPSRSINLDFPSETIEKLNSVVAAVNIRRQEIIDAQSERESARQELSRQAWSLITSKLKTEIAVYQSNAEIIETQIRDQEVRIRAEEQVLSELQSRLSHLEEQRVSSLPTIRAINRILEAVGFRGFSLVESTRLRGGYEIARADGSPASKTLSDGERTFVTFLYFMHELEGYVPEEPERNRIAIIDDPINSLDSDVMFAVSAILKQLMRRIAAEVGPVMQLIILTHNTYFHKEVSYLRRGETSGHRAYFTIQKNVSEANHVTRSNSSTVRPEYVRLWDYLGANRAAQHEVIGVQNAMRRVIEHYFRSTGTVDESLLVEKFEGEQQAIARSFFSWINEGSHALFDGLEYAPSQASIDAFYEVFREVFYKSDQLGHYNMMTLEW